MVIHIMLHYYRIINLVKIIRKQFEYKYIIYDILKYLFKLKLINIISIIVL